LSGVKALDPICYNVSEIGPAGMKFDIVNGINYDVWTRPVPSVYSGATQAILTNVSNYIWVGTVNGGIWRTSNGGQSWKVVTDDKLSLSITSLEFDQHDPTHQTIIAAVGATSSLSLSSGPMVGFYLSHDGGDTWSTNPDWMLFRQLQMSMRRFYKFGPKLVGCVRWRPTYQNIVVSNSSGSVGSWGFTGPVCKGCVSFLYVKEWDLIIGAFFDTPSNPGTSEMMYSPDHGDTWLSMPNWKTVSDAAPPLAGASIAASSQGQGALYVMLAWEDDTIPERLFVCSPFSVNCNFVSVNVPVNIINNVDIHYFIYADPTNCTRLYAGKLQVLYRYDGIDPVTGAYEKFTDTQHNSRSHADGRCAVYDSNGDLLHGDDGSIFKRLDPSSDSGEWVSLGANIAATECVTGAYDPRTKLGVCGFQDNGISVGRKGEMWLDLIAGDGHRVKIERQQTPPRFYWGVGAGQFHWVPSVNEFPYTSQAVVDGNQTGLECFNNLTGSIPMGAYFFWEINRYSSVHRFVMRAKDHYWECIGNDPPYQLIPSTCLNDLAYSGITNGVPNPDLLWIPDCATGNIYLRTSLGAPFQVFSLPGVHPNGIETDPTDGFTAYVSANKYYNFVLYKTWNGGQNFTDITGNFQQVFYEINNHTEWNDDKDKITAMTVIKSTRNTNVIYIAGCTGVYYAEDPGLEPTPLNWTQVKGIPNAVKADFSRDEETNSVILSTIGRGMWLIENAGKICDSPTPTMSLSSSASVTSSIQPSPTVTLSSTTAVVRSVTTTPISPVINHSSEPSAKRSHQPHRTKGKNTPHQTNTQKPKPPPNKLLLSLHFRS